MPQSRNTKCSNLAVGVGMGIANELAGLLPWLNSTAGTVKTGCSLETLRDANDPDRCALVLWCGGDGKSSQATAALDAALKDQLSSRWNGGIAWRCFDTLLELGEAGAPSPVANLIIREIESTQLESFLGLLKPQMQWVSAQPGCLGVYLGQECKHPNVLFGITRWDSIPALDAYMKWSGAHEFKPVVDPLTRATPLRLRGVPLQ